MKQNQPRQEQSYKMDNKGNFFGTVGFSMKVGDQMVP
jgi:hypothetical protein